MFRPRLGHPQVQNNLKKYIGTVKLSWILPQYVVFKLSVNLKMA